jgi:nitroreductase
MFNDLSSPAALVATRRSAKPRTMVAPGPDPDQLGRILDAAIRVPDHGKLAPWRIVVIPPDKRFAFATLLHHAASKLEAGTKPPSTDAIEEFAHQAPCLVAVLSTPVQPSHIPLWEQELSAGAVCMNLLTAVHAEGFVGAWLSGWASFSPDVLKALGGREGDRIAGFIYIGSQGRELEERPRPRRQTVVSEWQG